MSSGRAAAEHGATPNAAVPSEPPPVRYVGLFPDRLARTLVVEAPDVSVFEQRRIAQRETSILPPRAGRDPAVDGAAAPPVRSERSPHSGDDGTGSAGVS